jgi:ectoine hydroxylase-related dioxygenase (phytanoyl-CoA dioxygenase family)
MASPGGAAHRNSPYTHESLAQGAPSLWQQSLHDQGFVVFPGLVEPGEIEDLPNNLAHLEHKRARAGIRHLLHDPTVAALAADPRLLGIAQAVLGDKAFPFCATLFDKSPDSNWLITWHQDTALPLTEKRDAPGWGPWSVKEGVTYAHAPATALSQVLALRLHLDDCAGDNGPLRVLPGTHSMGVLSDDQILNLAAGHSSDSAHSPASHSAHSLVECLVPQGGVLAMRPLIIHASSKSQSQRPRRVLHIEYAARVEISEGMRLATA